jgi:hypothetical protein
MNETHSLDAFIVELEGKMAGLQAKIDQDAADIEEGQNCDHPEPRAAIHRRLYEVWCSAIDLLNDIEDGLKALAANSGDDRAAAKAEGTQ